MVNPLTLTHSGRPGLTVEAFEQGSSFAWQVKIGMVSIGEDGCASEAEAMAAGVNCARQLLEQWIGELAGIAPNGAPAT